MISSLMIRFKFDLGLPSNQSSAYTNKNYWNQGFSILVYAHTIRMTHVHSCKCQSILKQKIIFSFQQSSITHNNAANHFHGLPQTRTRLASSPGRFFPSPSRSIIGKNGLGTRLGPGCTCTYPVMHSPSTSLLYTITWPYMIATDSI